MSYTHTQRAPLHLMLHALGLGILLGAWANRAELPVCIILAVVGLTVNLAALMFAHMTVRDEGDALAIHYGPIPLFRRRFRYDEITHYESSQSSVIDGWGIHWIPGRGWTYNLWGLQCVKMIVDGKTVRVGSDDVENLIRFLQTKVQPSDR